MTLVCDGAWCADNPDWRAYVYPSWPGQKSVFFCPPYFDLPAKGKTSRMGTMMHEASHYSDGANTDDHARGLEDSKNLAKNDQVKPETMQTISDTFANVLTAQEVPGATHISKRGVEQTNLTFTEKLILSCSAARRLHRVKVWIFISEPKLIKRVGIPTFLTLHSRLAMMFSKLVHTASFT